jgi:hypothetical protein
MAKPAKGWLTFFGPGSRAKDSQRRFVEGGWWRHDSGESPGEIVKHRMGQGTVGQPAPEAVAVLCTQERCSRVFGQTSRRPSRTRARHWRWRAAAARRSRADSGRAGDRASAALSRGRHGEADQFLAAFRRRADQHQDALLSVLEACLEMNAIGPDVDVHFADRPRFCHAVCSASQPSFRRRWPMPATRHVLAEQRRLRFGEVARRDPPEIGSAAASRSDFDRRM